MPRRLRGEGRFSTSAVTEFKSDRFGKHSTTTYTVFLSEAAPQVSAGETLARNTTTTSSSKLQ
jgi:hypothetical protein